MFLGKCFKILEAQLPLVSGSEQHSVVVEKRHRLSDKYRNSLVTVVIIRPSTPTL